MPLRLAETPVADRPRERLWALGAATLMWAGATDQGLKPSLATIEL